MKIMLMMTMIVIVLYSSLQRQYKVHKHTYGFFYEGAVIHIVEFGYTKLLATFVTDDN